LYDAKGPELGVRKPGFQLISTTNSSHDPDELCALSKSYNPGLIMEREALLKNGLM
jgi:hypothetical protein